EVRHPAGIVVDVRHVAGDRLGGGLADDVDRGPTAAEIDDHRRHAIHAVPAAPVIAVRQLPGEKVDPVVDAGGGRVDVLQVAGQVQAFVRLPLETGTDVGGHRVAPVHASGGGDQRVVEGAVLELAFRREAERVREHLVARDGGRYEPPSIGRPVHHVLGVVVEI